jgi:hypothetical protein
MAFQVFKWILASLWLLQETKQVLARVKEEETSVTGAVGAAGLVAIRSILGDDAKNPHLYAQINICLRANAVKRGAFGECLLLSRSVLAKARFMRAVPRGLRPHI